MSRSKVPMAMTPRGPSSTVAGPYPVRRTVAFMLQAASAALDRLAQRVSAPPVRHASASASEFEFYAQAGAPEGALYVDGQFVGWIRGVQRL